jgi:hypothetical protein
MEVKASVSASLLLFLLVCKPHCGLQGVEASPVSSLISEYPDQTSVLRSSAAGDAETELGEVIITGEIGESEDPGTITSDSRMKGGLVYNLYSMTIWHRGEGNVTLVYGGVGYDGWTITWEVPRMTTASVEIRAVVGSQVSRHVRLTSEHCDAVTSQFYALKRLHYHTAQASPTL